MTLTPETGAAPAGTPTPLGTLNGFQTTEPAMSCLSQAVDLPVVREPTGTTEVVASLSADCVPARFTLTSG